MNKQDIHWFGRISDFREQGVELAERGLERVGDRGNEDLPSFVII